MQKCDHVWPDDGQRILNLLSSLWGKILVKVIDHFLALQAIYYANLIFATYKINVLLQVNTISLADFINEKVATRRNSDKGKVVMKLDIEGQISSYYYSQISN